MATERFIFGKDIDAQGMAGVVIRLINEDRAKRGLPPLPKTRAEAERLKAEAKSEKP